MTLPEIQTEFTGSPCVATLTFGQLLWLIVKLLWNNTQGGGSTVMTLADIQTQFNESPCVATLARGQLEQLVVMLLNSGGSGGAIALEGDNFCFGGAAPNQVLKIKNLDTALANPIYTAGADGSQGVVLNNGEAC